MPAVHADTGVKPVVVDLGKKKTKDIKALKRGEGKLMEDVQRVIQEVRANSTELAGKELVPVVILYRKMPKRRAAAMLPFGLGG
jgi:hypothetical protein